MTLDKDTLTSAEAARDRLLDLQHSAEVARGTGRLGQTDALGRDATMNVVRARNSFDEVGRERLASRGPGGPR